jgi:hypothetical protein
MLRTSNIGEISEIKFIPQSLNKRLKREINSIKEAYDDIIIDCSDNKNIFISLNRKNNCYLFTIPFNYPFVPPDVSINGINICQFYNLKSIRFTKILKYVSNIDCLCCQSYTCRRNWTPGLTLDKLVDQIEKFKSYKYFIFIKIIIDKLKDQYLIKDIDIESWLINIK